MTDRVIEDESYIAIEECGATDPSEEIPRVEFLIGSIAISLKRIADALEGGAVPVRRFAGYEAVSDHAELSALDDLARRVRGRT